MRIRIIDSCSMSLRSLRRSSISWMSWVRPSASKRFDGLKNCEVGLVEIGDGDGFEFEAVLRQRLGGGLP